MEFPWPGRSPANRPKPGHNAPEEDQIPAYMVLLVPLGKKPLCFLGLAKGTMISFVVVLFVPLRDLPEALPKSSRTRADADPN